jgi:hypothetical protein
MTTEPTTPADALRAADEKRRAFTRQLNYTLWMADPENGCEPTQEWKDGYRAALAAHHGAPAVDEAAGVASWLRSVALADGWSLVDRTRLLSAADTLARHPAVQADGKGEAYPLQARIWKRDSTQEWVLEISGSINDTDFTCRHTEPLTTVPEDVAGLPSMYAPPAAQASDTGREAVAWAQIEEGEVVGLAFKRNDRGGCTTPLYTHTPASEDRAGKDGELLDWLEANGESIQLASQVIGGYRFLRDPIGTSRAAIDAAREGGQS